MYHEQMIHVTAAEYNRNAVKLLEQVRTTGESVQITKQGQPIAQLVKIDPVAPQRQFGQFRSEVTLVGDVIGPIIFEEEWGGTL